MFLLRRRMLKELGNLIRGSHSTSERECKRCSPDIQLIALEALHACTLSGSSRPTDFFCRKCWKSAEVQPLDPSEFQTHHLAQSAKGPEQVELEVCSPAEGDYCIHSVFLIALHDDSWPATTTVEMDSQLTLISRHYNTYMMAFKSNLGFKMQIFSEDMAQKEAKSCPSELSIGFRREWLRITFPKLPVLAFTDTWRYHEAAMWHLGKCGFAFFAKVSLCVYESLCMPVIIGIRAWQQRKCNEPPYLFSFANQSFVFAERLQCSALEGWKEISPAYDPNSKDTSNSHSFCFGTHWKFENFHQYSSPKHHNTITKTSPQHHHPSLRHQSITDTEQRHHQHKTKASPTYHQNITTQSLHITDTSLKDHQNITIAHAENILTHHQRITETSPRYHRIIHETQTKHNRDITETSPKHHQDITET